MDDRTMLRSLKHDINQLFNQSSIDVDAKWHYERRRDKPDDMHLEIKLSFVIPEKNLDVSMNQLDFIKSDIEDLVDGTPNIWR